MTYVNRPSWAPERIRLGREGVEFHFEQVAPITGDALYQGQRKEMVVFALVACPDSFRNQDRFFSASQVKNRRTDKRRGKLKGVKRETL